MACPSAPAVAVTVGQHLLAGLPAEEHSCSVTVDPASTAPMSPEMLAGCAAERVEQVDDGGRRIGLGRQEPGSERRATAAGTNGTSSAAPRATTRDSRSPVHESSTLSSSISACAHDALSLTRDQTVHAVADLVRLAAATGHRRCARRCARRRGR